MQSFSFLFKRVLSRDLAFKLSQRFATKFSNQTNKLLFQGTPRLKNPKLTPETREAITSSLSDFMGPISSSNFSPISGDSVRVQDIYKQMDSSLEGFFYKRKYDTKNFNFLLQILAEQKKFDESLKVFEKMKQMGIKPDKISYLQLLTACSKAKNDAKAEEIFLEAKNNPKIGISIQMYNSLMMCYTRRHEPQKAFKILQEMKEEGFKPDIVCYTTVINAFKNAKDLPKCWELFEHALTKEFLIPDENLVGLMIEICAGLLKTHDAEKAKRYFNDLLDLDFKHTCLPYNAMIKALGSRKDYAAEAINFYEQMVAKSIVPDADTFIAVFKACGLSGDVKTAYNAMIHMKEQNIPMSIYMYNGLLRTYAAAMEGDYVSIELKDLYIEDAWNLFQKLQTVDNLPVSVSILNSLLLVHTKANVPEKVEGLVLPLYDQYGIKRDQFTYEHLTDMYLKKRDVDTVIRLYEVAKKENLDPTYNNMNYYLETAMRLQDTDKIVEVLQDFKKQGREPKLFYLKKLGRAEDMPDRVYLELIEFKSKFGFVAEKVKRHQSKDKFLTM